MTLLLGIDLGTSSVKVLLLTEGGQVLGHGSGEYPINTPQPGWAEQDPQAWWDASVKAVRQAIVGVPERESIAAIGISGQMHGTVLLDQQGQILHPAVIWPDQRTTRQVDEISNLIGDKKLINITGSSIATGFQAATIRWFQQEERDIWSRVHQVLLPKDYLRWRMTGEFASDASDGSGTLLLDGQKRSWSSQILKKLDIEANLLPPIQSSHALAGELIPAAADDFGLPGGIPVFTGAADTASSLLGAGATNPKNLLMTIGTGGQLILPAFNFIVDEGGRMHTFCSALEPLPHQAGWYLMSATLSAGQSLRWLRDNVFSLDGEDAYDQMTAWAEEVPLGANGLIFLPYLVGERTPLMDSHARGAFLGLTLSHGQAELVRAVMEGVTFSLYEAFLVLLEAGIQPERIIISGGGARSRLWQQIVADVFGLPVMRLRVNEASALGAALLAGAGSGHLEMVEASHLWAIYDHPFEPNYSDRALYLELLEIFQLTYLKYKDEFLKLDAAQGWQSASKL
jgi:xylulokinase